MMPDVMHHKSAATASPEVTAGFQERGKPSDPLSRDSPTEAYRGF